MSYLSENAGPEVEEAMVDIDCDIDIRDCASASSKCASNTEVRSVRGRYLADSEHTG